MTPTAERLLICRASRTKKGFVVLALLLSLPCAFTHASYGIYVGKNCSTDGIVFLAGYGDEPSSHWLEIVPRRRHPSGTTIKVGVTDQARYPGEMIDIPQVAETAKYITTNYSYYAGFPGPLTNGGMNEHGVAARDIWSPSRDELREMTPKPQRGPNYSDLARIVMERAKSAREAVEIVGELIGKYGFSTYGGNSHLFADPDEGWVVINFAGGKGLWVAERLGADDIRVSRPGYIGEIPLDYQDNPDYMGSPNLISFAVDQGWYNPKSGQPFNVNKIYGDGKMRYPAVRIIEERLGKLKGRITLQDVIAVVRAPEVTHDSNGYGQVAPLRKDVHRELRTLWVTTTTPAVAPFIPYRIGVGRVPPEYGKHRYLTHGEATRFIDPSQRSVESTRSAFRASKRLFYLAEEHRDKFLPEITEALEAFEARLIAQQASVERTALKLYEADEPELARKYLTYYINTEAMSGLRLVEALVASIEARTNALFGIRR
jgi:dipeptidase